MKYFSACLILFLCYGCTGEAQTYPGKTWDTHEDPSLLGWGETGRSLFTRYIVDSTNITGLVLVHKGKIVLEYGDLEENSYIASCRKSVLAMLMGNYVEDGSLDLEKSLKEMEITDVTPLLPIEQEATLRDLIASRSGVFLSGSNGGDFRRYAPERESVNPGSYWLYSNWDFNLAGYIFEQQTKTNIYDAIESELAIPLQMEDWDRSLQEKHGDVSISKFPAYHMWFSTRDMARLGLLMLRKGEWNDQQVIPEDWVTAITSQHTSYREAQKNVPVLKKDGLDLGYGYMWWLIENTDDYRLRNAYSAQGALGQNITVYPTIDVVLAFKTRRVYRRGNSIQTQMKVIQKAVEMYYPDHK